MAKNNILNWVGIDNYYLLRQLRLYLRLFFKYASVKKIRNLIRCEYELFMKKTHLKSMPYAVKLEVNNTCNLDCALCPRKESNYGLGYVSFEDFKKMFDQFKDYMFYCSPHYLGESFLHKDIAKIVSYIHENNVATYISTNLNYLNENLARDIVKSGLDVLSIAVDGANQETYSKYRERGNFDLLTKNLKIIVEQKKKLKSSTPLIELQFIVFRYNEDQIDTIQNLAKKIGVDSLRIRPGIVDYTSQNTKDKEEWLPKNKKYISRLYYKRSRVKKTCWWLWRTATITWNGEVYPCCRKVFKKSFGNILKNNFKDIWNNKEFIDSRKCFISKDKIESPCCSCEIPYGNIHG